MRAVREQGSTRRWLYSQLRIELLIVLRCTAWCVSGARLGESQAGPATSFGCVSETTRGLTPYGTPSGGPTTYFLSSAEGKR